MKILVIFIFILTSCKTVYDAAEVKQLNSPEDALSKVVQTRQHIKQIGLINTTSNGFLKAENYYRTALLDAEAGDYKSSFSNAGNAETQYKNLLLKALENGPVKVVLEKFEQIKIKLSDTQRKEAETKVTHLKNLLPNVHLGNYDVITYSDLVLEHIHVLDEYLGPDLFFDTTCLPPVQPEFFDLEVSEVSVSSLLTRSDINYVSGGELDVKVLIPKCTFISSIFVEVFGAESKLATTGSIIDPIEGTVSNLYYYTILDRTVQDDQLAVSLRIHFPEKRDGRTLNFRLVANSSKGLLTADENLTVVTVSEINSNQSFSISENQLNNDFIQGIYEDFGDNGRLVQDPVDMINPSYANFVLNISSTGMYFKTKQKADFPLCDPTITSSGTFHLEIVDSTVEVNWDSGPNVSSSLPLLCEIGAIFILPVRVAGGIIFNNMAEKKVKDRIQQKINSLVTTFTNIPGSGTNPLDFVQSIETREGEIVILYNTPGNNIVLEIPYQRLNLEENAFNHGMAVNLNEQLLISASGLTDVCTVGGSNPQGCNKTQTGPAGLFNWNLGNPIPNPWPCFSQSRTCTYFKQRHEARKRLIGLRRDETKLPFPLQNVGAFVGRLATPSSTSSYILLDDISVVNTPALGSNRIAFGNNDFRFAGAAELGSGSLTISISWPPIILEGLNPPTSNPFSLPDLLDELELNSR